LLKLFFCKGKRRLIEEKISHQQLHMNGYTAHINAPQTITQATIKQKHTRKLQVLDSIKISTVCDITAAPGNFETSNEVYCPH